MVPGDRVAILVPKSLASVVALFGILKAGAAYVPIDAYAPANRNAGIVRACGAKALFVPTSKWDTVAGEGLTAGAITSVSAMPALDTDAVSLVVLKDNQVETDVRPDLAYILFTSGSTGTPKGVVHTHASALAFVDWAQATFEPTAQDRFASHAPFHFDLSIFDLFVSVASGAQDHVWVPYQGQGSSKCPRQGLEKSRSGSAAAAARGLGLHRVGAHRRCQSPAVELGGCHRSRCQAATVR